MALPADLVPLTKLARDLGVHPATPHKWRRQGVKGVMLACVRVGGRWFVTENAAAAFLSALNGGQDVTQANAADESREDAFEAVLASRGERMPRIFHTTST